MLSFLADAYLHQLDPFAIRFPQGWVIPGLRWYGLSYAAGFLLAWWIIRRLAKARRILLAPEQAGDLMFYSIAGVLIGGRLGYAVFYDQALLTGFTADFPFWDLLAINKGGMASHGGMIGVIIACCWFARRRSVSSLHVIDIAAFVAPPGLFLGRIANFINGELHGRALPNQANPPWWSMKFPQEILDWPVQKLESLSTVFAKGNLAMSPGEWKFHLAQVDEHGRLPQEVWRALDQIIDAVQAGNQAVIEALRPMLTAYYPSQLIQAATDGPILLGALAVIWLFPRKPGVIGSWFLIIYAALRILTEFVREPDTGVSVWWGLSRGQWLSFTMLAGGIVCLWIASSRQVERICGLRTAPAITRVVD